MSDDAPPSFALVDRGEEYELLLAPGPIYRLRFHTESQTARLDGEDARRFANDLATVRAQFPTGTTDQILAQLWDQGGYSWLATPDEE
jgi:hypothetical protein